MFVLVLTLFVVAAECCLPVLRDLWMNATLFLDKNLPLSGHIIL